MSSPTCPICNNPIDAYRRYCKHFFKPFAVYYDYYADPSTEIYEYGQLLFRFDGFVKLDKEHIERWLLLK